MKNLFRTEFLRHRMLAAGGALLHFVVLYYLGTLTVFVHTMPFFTMWTIAMMVCGGGFGLYQFALHKRGNDWIHLMHRPLSTGQIFAPLALAGVAVCVLVTLVPPLLMFVLLEGNGLNGVEARQYLLLLFIAAATLCAYFCSIFAQLASSRVRFLVLAMPAAMIVYWTDPPSPLMPVVLLAWSILLARAAFKPDLARIPHRPTTWLLTELPIQYCFLWIVVTVLTVGEEVRAAMAGADSVRDPGRGTDLYVERMAPDDLFEYALQDASHPDAPFLLQQVGLAEFALVGNPQFMAGADNVRLPLAYPHLRLRDDERNLAWVFDYGAMLYAGYDEDSASFEGWLGPDGFHMGSTPPAKRFADAPWAEANRFLVGTHAIYHIDWDAQRVHKRYENAGTDSFTKSLAISDNLATLLSDDRLYVFSTAELNDIDVPLHPRAILDTPADASPEFRRFVVMELIDGYLVAALTNLTPTRLGPDFALLKRARLEVYRIRDGAEKELVASKPLPSTFSDGNIYKDFIAAPGMRLLTDMFWGLSLSKAPERTWPAFFHEFPAYIWMLAGLSSTVSAIVTAGLLRNTTLSHGAKAFWIVGNAFTGLAGLLSLFLGYYWRSGQLHEGGNAR